MKFILPRVGLLLTVGLISLLSCKKTNVSEHSPVKVETLQTSKIEKMTTFLSITLNVPKASVVYNSELKVFSGLNTLKFSYTTVEARYDVANEYKLNHE